MWADRTISAIFKFQVIVWVAFLVFALIDTGDVSLVAMLAPWAYIALLVSYLAHNALLRLRVKLDEWIDRKEEERRHV